MNNLTYTNDTPSLFIRTEASEFEPATSHQVLAVAMQIISHSMQRGTTLTSPRIVRDYLRLKLQPLEYEVFTMILLDSKQRVLEYIEMFRGTIDSCSVHAREVVKVALAKNAAAVIFAHNHPSGITEPSIADRAITERLKNALMLVDVLVLDHVIVGSDETFSFAERGLL